MDKTEKSLSEMTLEELWQLFPILLSPHNPEWKNWYCQEAGLLTQAFGNHLHTIHHIGSTAVEGLLAKPTVDILLEITPDSQPDTIRQIAQSCGYLVMAEQTGEPYTLDLCKGYTIHGFAEKVFHLHIRYPGDYDEIYFCNFLRNNPNKAKEYAELKQALQKQFKHNRDAYTFAKGDFIRNCVKTARSGQASTPSCQK